MQSVVIHRCPKDCPWHKKCFVCKTEGIIKEDVVILHKCQITKEDIPVHIGIGKNDLCAG